MQRSSEDVACLRAARTVAAIVLCSTQRRAYLRALRDAGPPDAWLSAGFVRNAVFDARFGPAAFALAADLDVIYLDGRDERRDTDRDFERALARACPGPWEVKNQARMARRNDHAGYRDLSHALAHFPETATAVAVRLGPCGLEILAPYGLGDLLAGVIRRSPCADPRAFAARRARKRWSERWIGVRVS